MGALRTAALNKLFIGRCTCCAVGSSGPSFIMVVMAQTFVPSWLLGQHSNCRTSSRVKENRDNPCGRVSVLQVTFGVYIPERRVCRSPSYVRHACVPAPPWKWWRVAIRGAMACASDTNNKCHKTNTMCHAEWNIFFFFKLWTQHLWSQPCELSFFCVCVHDRFFCQKCACMVS